MIVCKLPKPGPIGADGENLAVRLMIQSNCSLILEAHSRTGEGDLVPVRRPTRMRVARRVRQLVQPTPIGPDKIDTVLPVGLPVAGERDPVPFRRPPGKVVALSFGVRQVHAFTRCEVLDHQPPVLFIHKFEPIGGP